MTKIFIVLGIIVFLVLLYFGVVGFVRWIIRSDLRYIEADEEYKRAKSLADAMDVEKGKDTT